MGNAEQIGKKPLYSEYAGLLMAPAWLLFVAAPVLLVWQIVKYVMTGVWIHVSIVSVFSLFNVNAGSWTASTKGWSVIHTATAWIMFKMPFSLVLLIVGLLSIVVLGSLLKRIQLRAVKEK